MIYNSLLRGAPVQAMKRETIAMTKVQSQLRHSVSKVSANDNRFAIVRPAVGELIARYAELHLLTQTA